MTGPDRLAQRDRRPRVTGTGTEAGPPAIWSACGR